MWCLSGLLNWINPILIRVYPRKFRWPDLPHSNSNLFNSHSDSISLNSKASQLSSRATHQASHHSASSASTAHSQRLYLFVCGKQVWPTPTFGLAGAHSFLLPSWGFYWSITLRTLLISKLICKLPAVGYDRSIFLFTINFVYTWEVQLSMIQMHKSN